MHKQIKTTKETFKDTIKSLLSEYKDYTKVTDEAQFPNLNLVAKHFNLQALTVKEIVQLTKSTDKQLVILFIQTQCVPVFEELAESNNHISIDIEIT